MCTQYYSTKVPMCVSSALPPFFGTCLSFSILFKPFPCPSKAFQLTGHLEASPSWVPLLGSPHNPVTTGGPLTLSTPPPGVALGGVYRPIERVGRTLFGVYRRSLLEGLQRIALLQQATNHDLQLLFTRFILDSPAYSPPPPPFVAHSVSPVSGRFFPQ